MKESHKNVNLHQIKSLNLTFTYKKYKILMGNKGHPQDAISKTQNAGRSTRQITNPLSPTSKL